MTCLPQAVRSGLREKTSTPSVMLERRALAESNVYCTAAGTTGGCTIYRPTISRYEQSGRKVRYAEDNVRTGRAENTYLLP